MKNTKPTPTTNSPASKPAPKRIRNTPMKISDFKRGQIVTFNWLTGPTADRARSQKIRGHGKVVTKEDFPLMISAVAVQLTDDPKWIINPDLGITRGHRFYLQKEKQEKQKLVAAVAATPVKAEAVKPVKVKAPASKLATKAVKIAPVEIVVPIKAHIVTVIANTCAKTKRVSKTYRVSA